MSQKGKIKLLLALVVFAVVLHCAFPNKNVSIIEQIRETLRGDDVNEVDVNEVDVNEPISPESLADLAMKAKGVNL